MTYDNIIDSNKFTTAPSSSDDLYIWADYCEIACVLSREKSLSDEEIYKLYYQSKDLQPNDAPRAGKDKAIGFIRDAFNQIALRSSLLQTKYPFHIDQENMVITLKDDLYFYQNIYITLLYASNLKYLCSPQSHIFTSSFETISLHVMKELLPNATLKIFGSSNTDELSEEDKFSAIKLKERIPELSTLIYQEVYINAINELKDQNNGDNGLDIVGFINLKDERSSHPLFFAQCACSKESWFDKQKSTLRNEWMKYMNLTDTSIHNFILVPFMYMNNEKRWTDKQKITQNVLIDRLRIMNTITEERPFSTKALDVVKKELEFIA